MFLNSSATSVSVIITKTVAYHEAGHAIVGMALGIEMSHVVMGDVEAVCHPVGPEPDRSAAWAAMSVAGFVAEIIFEDTFEDTPSADTPPSDFDLDPDRVFVRAGFACDRVDIAGFLQHGGNATTIFETVEIILSYWTHIRALAERIGASYGYVNLSNHPLNHGNCIPLKESSHAEI